MTGLPEVKVTVWKEDVDDWRWRARRQDTGEAVDGGVYLDVARAEDAALSYAGARGLRIYVRADDRDAWEAERGGEVSG